MRFRGLLTLLFGLLLAVGCTYDSDIDTSGFGSEGEGVTTVNIRATLPEFGGVTRGKDSAQGGTTNIAWKDYSLRVIVKAYGDESEPEEYRGKEAVSKVLYLDDTSVGADGRVAISLDMPLTSGHTYDIYMWADYVKKDSDEDLHYNTESFPAIALNHDVPVINDETLDAFYGNAEIAVGEGYYVWAEGSQFPISRAVAKLRMVATDADSATATSATLQIDRFYKGFNIATGEPTQPSAAAVKSDKTRFEVYTDEDVTTTTKSFITAYMLWPAEESANIVAEFYEEGNDTAISTIQPANAIPLKRGNLTTLRGALLVTDSGWDGAVEQPEVLDGDTLVVSTPGQLLWLVENGAKVGDTEYKKIRLGADINVNNQADISPLKLYDDTDFDGNGKTLKGLGEPTTALFGSVQGLNAYNFTLEGYNVSAQDGHVGVLVNELSKSATFTDITIKDSSAKTSNGAAGGIVGYVDGGSSVNLDVVFKNCDLVNVKADATRAEGKSAEGKFVGLMQGYDNGETLSFDADCSVDGSCGVADYASPYTESNDAQWLDGDYPKSFDFTAYNGWLGDEEKYRGIVKFAGNRMQIKWDGETTVEPIWEDNNRKVAQIWSPFDLAYVGGTSLTTLRFKSDVDMAGVCDDCKNGRGDATIANDNLCTCTKCKPFNAIIALNNLYGENHTLYNLFVQGIHEVGGSYNDGWAFIRHTNAGTFENFTFDGAIIKSVYDERYKNDTENGGNAYAGTLTSRVAAKMTINNVHAKNGHVIGISKFGGLIGYVPGGIDANGCTVDNYIIENHRINVLNTYGVSIEKELAGVQVKAECAENFYTEGEAGGFIGFISSNATITDCHSSNIKMKCYGQDDRPTKINVYRWERKYVILGNYEWKYTLGIDYTIAGRHINTFIGDIRTPQSNVITINACSTSGTCVEGYDYNITKAGKGEIVGCCYFVGKDINVLDKSLHAGDYQGSVTIDGEPMPFIGG